MGLCRNGGYREIVSSMLKTIINNYDNLVRDFQTNQRRVSFPIIFVILFHQSQVQNWACNGPAGLTHNILNQSKPSNLGGVIKFL